MYLNIPVKKQTKERLDMFRKVLHAKSYDETVNELANANSFLILKDLEGIIQGSQRFKREQLERDFD